MTLNPFLRNFWFNDKGKIIRSRFRVLYGGRSSGKSHDIARFLIYISCRTDYKILCLRAFQNKMEDSVYSLIEDIITEEGLYDGFKFTKSNIINLKTGSTFLFKGLNRNTSSLKGLNNIMLVFIEEAEDITEEQFNILTPTIREEGSEIIIAFNPQLINDYIYQKFVINTPSNARTRHINYLENPFLSKTMLEEIDIYKKEDPEEYKYLYLGKVRDDDDLAIIKRSWLLECVGAKEKLESLGFSFNNLRSVIGYDVADDGGDTNAYCHQKGIEYVDLFEWKGKEDELFQSSQRVHSKALSANAIVHYDNIGVGAGIGSNINEINSSLKKKVKHFKFSAGTPPLNPTAFYRVGSRPTKEKNIEYFENIKAQAWITLADKLKATIRAINGSQIEKMEDMISFSPSLPLLSKLITELSSPRKVLSLNNKNAVEKKKDMLKRGIKSPNLADCVVMTHMKLNTSWTN